MTTSPLDFPRGIDTSEFKSMAAWIILMILGWLGIKASDPGTALTNLANTIVIAGTLAQAIYTLVRGWNKSIHLRSQALVNFTQQNTPSDPPPDPPVVKGTISVTNQTDPMATTIQGQPLSLSTATNTNGGSFSPRTHF